MGAKCLETPGLAPVPPISLNGAVFISVTTPHVALPRGVVSDDKCSQGGQDVISRWRSMVMAVAVFTVLAVAVVWGLSLRLQMQLQEQVLDRAEVRSVQLADAMGGQVEALFTLVDRTALDLRALWRANPQGFEEGVRRALDTLPPGLVSHVTVVNAQGYAVYNSLGVEDGTFVGDRPHFQALSQGPDQLVLGEPVFARLNGRWLFVAGRPLWRDGRFDGTVHLLISTDYLARKLGRLALSDQDLVGLVHPSGRFLARSLDNEAAMGQSLPPDRPFLKQPDLRQGSFRQTGKVDEVPRLFGWQRMSDSGAVVVVGLAEASALAPLAPSRRQAMELTVLLSLALAAIGAGMGWLLWRVERGQAAAARSEQRLKAAQRMAHVGHWEFDIQQRGLSWSDEVFRILGWVPNTILPSSEVYESSVYPDDLPRLERAFQDAIRLRMPLDEVHRIQRPDGEVRHVRLLCLTDFEGEEPVRHHGTLQDITELREMQFALVRLNGELEHRVKARTKELVELNSDLESFTYSVSHDLRTPLRSIHGFASLLQETEANRLTDEGRSFLLRIQDGARRMGVLITDLLSIAQHSRALISHEVVNLSDMARGLVVEFERAEPERRVQWHIEPGLRVQADPTLMRVVLQNLLGNAWKYTSLTPDAQISLTRSEGADGQVAFCVRDNGAGFDMAYAGQLFQPFKRLHAHHQFEGSGIGLATVHRVIQRHGGSVRGEGAVGQGAAFFFSLPEMPAIEALSAG